MPPDNPPYRPTAVSPEAVLARVSRTHETALTDAEAAALEAQAGASPLARRLLSMHYFKAGAFAKVVPHARELLRLDGNPESAKNLLAALNRAGLYDEALALTTDHAGHFDPVELAAGKCTLYGKLGRYGEAVIHGTEALRLKDAAVPLVDRPPAVVRAFDASRPERNVIAFSLFGNRQRYFQGALRNAIVAPHLYPGWTLRFYIDDSVPDEIVRGLLAEKAQVRKTPKLDAARFGLFWRFLVEDDPDVDLYLIRDADSVLNIRERAAVEDWLASGKPYHVMRDHPAHCDLILAGMWGAHRGNLGHMGKRMLAFVRARERKLNDRTSDQAFLREAIWPLIRRDALVHDAWFRFGDARPFRQELSLPWPMHVGQNDEARMAAAAG